MGLPTRFIASHGVRLVAHMVMVLPLALLLLRWADMISGTDPRQAGLSAEPIAYTINYLGLWALRALWASLAVTPVRRLSGRAEIALLRRPLGLWAFAYALLHLTVYFGFDQLASPVLLWRDVTQHKFAFFGMGALLLLIPLAVTSTRGMIRRLGGRRWQRLHRLVYPAAILAALHFIFRVKGIQPEPWLYAGLLALLLALRIAARRRRTRENFPSGRE